MVDWGLPHFLCPVALGRDRRLRLRWSERSLRERTNLTCGYHPWAPSSANTFPWTSRPQEAGKEIRQGREGKSEEEQRRAGGRSESHVAISRKPMVLGSPLCTRHTQGT